MARIIEPIVIGVISLIIFLIYLRLRKNTSIRKIIEKDPLLLLSTLTLLAALISSSLVVVNIILAQLGYSLFILQTDEQNSGIILGAGVIVLMSFKELMQNERRIIKRANRTSGVPSKKLPFKT